MKIRQQYSASGKAATLREKQLARGGPRQKEQLTRGGHALKKGEAISQW